MTFFKVDVDGWKVSEKWEKKNNHAFSMSSKHESQGQAQMH